MLKLLNINPISDKIVRLQSQLYVGGDTADFILEDGILKQYDNGDKGFNFYEVNIPYQIVNTIKDMEVQIL